jgi:predicted Zn-dependent protease with MMP-like domain
MFRRVDSGLSSQSSEEISWQRKVLGSASIEEYTEEDFLDDVQLEIISKLFGLYEDRRLPKFNGKFFLPVTHQDFTE